MRQNHFALALLTAAVLAGCGGSRTGDQTPKTKFSAQVTFGDSLSDVGTYAVGAVLALGGGKFTINGDNTAINPALTGKNYTELLAAQFGLPAPCAAQTGLNGLSQAALAAQQAQPALASLAPLSPQGFLVPVVNHAGCFGYAQGGARVTEAAGPGNATLDASLGGSAVLGQLTVPVATQVQNHLALPASGGKFKGDEIVFVMAGANDVLVQLAMLNVKATAVGTAAATVAVTAAVPGRVTSDIAAGLCKPIDLQLSNCVAQAIAELTPTVGASAGAAAAAVYITNIGGPAALQAMGKVGVDLVALVKTQIVGNSANFVTVNNLPDVATTPFALGKSASIQGLIGAMVTAFNAQLASGFAGESRVLLVDVFSVSHDQAVNPGPYGLTNVTATACDLTSPARNPLRSSLVCNGSNLVAGDVSHYAFVDLVHPTPFNNLLLARYVAEKLVVRGWL